MVSKRELKQEVRDFARAFYFEFLRHEIGLVPSIDSFVRKISWSSNVLDFFSADELKREFLIYSGLSDRVFEDAGMEWPNDFLEQMKRGSEEGLLEWLQENVNKICRDEGVARVWVMERVPDGWIVFLDSKGLSKREAVEYVKSKIEEDVNDERVWLFKVNEKPSSEDEKWADLFSVIVRWKTRGVEVLEYASEDVEECWVEFEVGDLLKPLYEAIELDALYKGAHMYKKMQPGEIDRVEAGERLIYNVTDVKFIPFWGTRELWIFGKVKSETKPLSEYSPRVAVENMLLDHEFSETTPIKLVDGKTGEEFYCRFINPHDKVRVWCSCKDFHNRFSWVLKRMRAVQGPIFPVKRKTTTRKGVNVAQVPSACKHVFALTEALVRAKMISTAWRSVREIDLTKGWFV